MPYFLEVKEVTKSFSGRNNKIEALHKVSLQVAEGEIVSIVGPSGCGKSTLLDIISGLSLPDQGEIYLNGLNITGKRGLAGYMRQKDSLFPWRTITDNVIVPLEVQGVSKKAARAKVFSLLPVFGLEKFADSYPDMLSGGMRQRASFLRTYLSQREIMLLDEPFGKLDAMTRSQLQSWFQEVWQSFRQTVLFVTHDIEEAILLSDRIYVFSGRPGEVTGEIAVNLDRPRSANRTTENDFVELKRKLLKLLEKSI